MVYKKVIGFIMAFALLCTAFVTVASHTTKNKMNMAQPHEWLFDDSTLDPTDPQNYRLNTVGPSLFDDCEQQAEICGIIAPVDPTSSPSDPKPLIDEALQERIESEDTNHEDVFLLPKSS